MTMLTTRDGGVTARGNNSKDDGEGLAGPTDGLIQRPLLIQEARIIGPHVCDGIVIRMFTGAC